MDLNYTQKMNPLTDTIVQSMTNSIGKELLIELWNAPWENFSPKHIEDLGIGICSRTGEKRSRNEDRLAIAHVSTQAQERFSVAIICDGVGGSERGDIAATLATATFLAELAQMAKPMPLKSLLTTLIRKMDDAVRNQLRGRGLTTVGVVLASATGELAAANIGDSRIFSWCPGISIKQISVDDTLENDLKGLAINDAILDARGIRGQLSQAIGEIRRWPDDLRIVVFENKHFPDVGIMLATDGAWKADEKGFTLIARGAKSAHEAITRIPRFASWTGGIDNISLIAIEDFLGFASTNKSPQFGMATAAKVTAWICDNKFVVTDVNARPAMTSQKPNLSASTELLSEYPKNKQAIKKASTKKRGYLPLKDQQLELMPESGQLEHPANLKPKIEIATGDKPGSYREVYLEK